MKKYGAYFMAAMWMIGVLSARPAFADDVAHAAVVGGFPAPKELPAGGVVGPSPTGGGTVGTTGTGDTSGTITNGGTAEKTLADSVSNPSGSVAFLPQPQKKMSTCTKALLIGGAALAGIVGTGAILNELDGGMGASNDKAARPGDINSKTDAQTKCASEAPAKPGRIIIGFEGLGGYAYGGGLYRNMLTPANNLPRTQTHYYSQAMVTDDTLSDAVRCAYELATKPYKTKDGKTVYNSITILGYSYGGHAASQAVENLRKLGVSVDLVVTADPRTKWSDPTVRFNKPNTVGKWVNYYETLDLPLRGYEVPGAQNVHIPGFVPHVVLTSNSTVYNGTADLLKNVPLCRADWRMQLGPAPSSCD